MVNFEIKLPKKFRMRGAIKWVITPTTVRQVYAKTNKTDKSVRSVNSNHIQQLAKRREFIRILYPYFIFIFKVKNAKTPESRKNDTINGIICSSFDKTKQLIRLWNATIFNDNFGTLAVYYSPLKNAVFA